MIFGDEIIKYVIAYVCKIGKKYLPEMGIEPMLTNVNWILKPTP